MASAIPTATLYLADHESDAKPFTPFFLPANSNRYVGNSNPILDRVYNRSWAITVSL